MIIKCKMCGGDIQFNPGDTWGQCDHCGCTSTFPKIPDEQRANLFNRANHFRRQCEFDKAVTAYERILEEDNTDAEAYWGIVLSRFGIEYVEDPVTHERIPTCHRAQIVSILSDEDYQNALKYAADTYSREIYEKEAKRIAEIQKGILAISSQEKPYDVFICYKETDDNGNRTKDSALAQEIYYQLINEGYKVFFSRITLEDKLGQQYEPYIFAALNSAKVMLVVGTKPEHFNAVWVKNEWSRFLALMKNDRKRVLIPCYRDMDPYDLPEELSSLQSQDMSKIGFVQDLIRGVKKVLNADKQRAQSTSTQVVASGTPLPSGNPTIESLLQRAFLFLEDGDNDSADQYFDRVLDADPKNSMAYIGKMLIDLKLRKIDDLSSAEPFNENVNYQKAIRFSSANSLYVQQCDKVKEYADRILQEEGVCYALAYGDYQKAERLIDDGCDIDCTIVVDDEGFSSLYYCILRNQPVLVKKLLERGADPNSERKTDDGQCYSALIDSIMTWPSDEIAHILIDAGADVNYKAKLADVELPVLTCAVSCENISIVKHLLEKGADSNCQRVFSNDCYSNVLDDSIVEWRNNEIANLLIEAGADVDGVSKYPEQKCPVLNSAISVGNIGIVKKLLEKKANPNCERILDDGQHSTALCDSIIVWPNNEITKLLINSGADVDAVCKLNDTVAPALICAIATSNKEIVKLLLERKANPNCERKNENNEPGSALTDSVYRWPNVDITKMLLDAGADINTVDHENGLSYPVLIRAISNKDEKMVKLLLDSGANPNCEMKWDGSTDSALSLSIAIWPSNAIAYMLINKGANVNYIIQDKGEKCPILISAISTGNEEMVKRLLEKGADPNCERIAADGKRFNALTDSKTTWPNKAIHKLIMTAKLGKRFKR